MEEEGAVVSDLWCLAKFQTKLPSQGVMRAVIIIEVGRVLGWEALERQFWLDPSRGA